MLLTFFWQLLGEFVPVCPLFPSFSPNQEVLPLPHRQAHEFHHGAELHTAAVSPDGKFLGTAGSDCQARPGSNVSYSSCECFIHGIPWMWLLRYDWYGIQPSSNPVLFHLDRQDVCTVKGAPWQIVSNCWALPSYASWPHFLTLYAKTLFQFQVYRPHFFFAQSLIMFSATFTS